jgi:tRNA(Ile)-lysidine synthase
MTAGRFRDTIKKFELLKKKDKVILGVSAGPDSVCMLHQFLVLAQEYKLRLVCAHFNHGLREEADREEQFIRDMCRELGLEFVSEKKDVNKFFKGDSLEQTARNLRFDFFLRCSRQTKIKKLALAHHKDDLAETVLMRLIRGAGLKGLRGFLPKTRFGSLTVIRPMLELKKQDILAWLKKENISYCLDESNLEDKFLRNRIRFELLPFLEKFNPNIVETLCNLSRTVALDYDFMYRFSYDVFLALKKKEAPRKLGLRLDGLKELAPAIFNNVIRIAIQELKGDTRRLDTRHLEEVRDLVFARPTGSLVDLPQIIVKKEENTLWIQI